MNHGLFRVCACFGAGCLLTVGSCGMRYLASLPLWGDLEVLGFPCSILAYRCRVAPWSGTAQGMNGTRVMKSGAKVYTLMYVFVVRFSERVSSAVGEKVAGGSKPLN